MSQTSNNTKCTLCESIKGEQSWLDKLTEKTKTSGIPQTLVMDRSPICSSYNTILIELGATMQATVPSSANFIFRIIDS
jgi:hypothetical protein